MQIKDIIKEEFEDFGFFDFSICFQNYRNIYVFECVLAFWVYFALEIVILSIGFGFCVFFCI